MKFSSTVGALALALVFGSALGDGPPFVEVSPPVGAKWAQVQANDYSAVWMKHTGDADLSFGVAILSQPVRERFESDQAFASWVTDQKASNPDPKRFETVQNDVAPAGDDRATCVRYETVVLDRQPGGGQPLRLQIGGLACLHPDSPDLYYDVQYSGRTPDSMRLNTTLLREGWAFVNSVRFTAPDADAGPERPGKPAPVEREST